VGKLNETYAVGCANLITDNNTDTGLDASGLPAYTGQSATCQDLASSHLCTDPKVGNEVVRACPESCAMYVPNSKEISCNYDLDCTYNYASLSCIPDFSTVLGADSNLLATYAGSGEDSSCHSQCTPANSDTSCTNAINTAVYGALHLKQCKANNGVDCESTYGRGPWACHYNEQGALCPGGDTFTIQCSSGQWVPPFSSGATSSLLLQTSTPAVPFDVSEIPPHCDYVSSDGDLHVVHCDDTGDQNYPEGHYIYDAACGCHYKCDVSNPICPSTQDSEGAEALAALLDDSDPQTLLQTLASSQHKMSWGMCYM